MQNTIKLKQHKQCSTSLPNNIPLHYHSRSRVFICQGNNGSGNLRKQKTVIEVDQEQLVANSREPKKTEGMAETSQFFLATIPSLYFSKIPDQICSVNEVKEDFKRSREEFLLLSDITPKKKQKMMNSNISNPKDNTYQSPSLCNSQKKCKPKFAVKRSRFGDCPFFDSHHDTCDGNSDKEEEEDGYGGSGDDNNAQEEFEGKEDFFLDHKRRRIMSSLEQILERTTLKSPLNNPSINKHDASNSKKNNANQFLFNQSTNIHPKAKKTAMSSSISTICNVERSSNNSMDDEMSALSFSMNKSCWIESFDMCSSIQLFNNYCDMKDGTHIISWGLNRLHDDIGFKDIFNVKYFLWMYLFDCKSRMRITRTEWSFGMFKLQCDSIEKLKRRLFEAEGEFKKWDVGKMKHFMTFVFHFLRDSSQTRNICSSVASKVLSVIFPSSRFTERFSAFLSIDKRYRCINIDQWKIFADFSQNINPDLSNYDPADSWPTIYDSFVEWVIRNGLQNTSSLQTETHRPCFQEINDDDLSMMRE